MYFFLKHMQITDVFLNVIPLLLWVSLELGGLLVKCSKTDVTLLPVTRTLQGFF